MTALAELRSGKPFEIREYHTGRRFAADDPYRRRSVPGKAIGISQVRLLDNIHNIGKTHSVRFKENKKYAILVAHLLNLSQELIDLAIEIHDRQIMILQSKGRKTQEEMQKQNGKLVNEKVIHFADIGSALIKAKEEGLDPFTVIEKVMPWNDVIASIEEAKKLARPMDYDYLDLLETKFNYLRKYTPTLLSTLEFRSTKSSESLLKALEVIREINISGKRKVPEGNTCRRSVKMTATA